MWCLAALLLVADTSSHSFSIAVSPAESVQVTIAGSGRPVVLIPSLFGCAACYGDVIGLLNKAGFRTIVVEALGIGIAGHPEHADYSLTAQADRIAFVLDRLSVTQAVLVAHTVGASMAYRLAYRRPDLVGGIVSLDGGPAEAAATPGFRRALRFILVEVVRRLPDPGRCARAGAGLARQSGDVGVGSGVHRRPRACSELRA
jgi:pimeloyl-ACP methyl ester carboxylesterase